MRSVNKLQSLVHSYMETIPAQEILLPSLTRAHLLQKTGRLDTPELFKLKDRNDKEFVLSPTHEEAITNLLASENPIAVNRLPLRLYQISRKFRDEMRPKSGLIRSREFIMKDLYCFDNSAESSDKTYKEVLDCYNRFFKSLKVPFVVVKGETGDMGEGISHEFHFLTEAGDDHLLLCKDCGSGVNLVQGEGESNCEECKSLNVTKQRGIEVVIACNDEFLFEASLIYFYGFVGRACFSFRKKIFRTIKRTIQKSRRKTKYFRNELLWSWDNKNYCCSC